MSNQQKISYKKFDDSWRLTATVGKGGEINAEVDRIAAAMLLLIRDDIRTQIGLQREQNKILRAISRKLARRKPAKRKTT